MSMRIDTPDDESAIRQPTDNIPPRDVIRTFMATYALQPNARAKGRGRTKPGETGQSITPRPLEHRVGRSRYAEKAIPICLSKT